MSSFQKQTCSSLGERNKEDNSMPYAAIDLFCGVGGLTKGLEQSGINVVAGIDFEPSCQYAYEENNNAKFIQRDITTLTPKELVALYPAGLDIHILAGCAPCQPFSKYTQRYRKDGYKDEKWRLLYSFGSLAKAIRPQIIAMENVPELEKTAVFRDFTRELEDCGYHIFHKIVYCPDYGIPQSRKRLVLLASLLGEISLLPATHTPDNYVTVKDAIGDLPPLIAGSTDPNDLLHSATALSEKNLKRIRQSIPGGTWRDWDKELQLKCHKKSSGKTYPSVYGRMLWDAPSPTITTQFYGYGNGRFGHPVQDRALSLREGAILQSFPKDYKFVSSTDILNKHKLGLQIGNAVPVRLGKIIGLSILEHIRRYDNGKEKSNA